MTERERERQPAREGTQAGGMGEEEAGSQWRREPNEGPNPSDEGTEGKLRTKQKLKPRNPPLHGMYVTFLRHSWLP